MKARCCAAMQYALAEGYLQERLQAVVVQSTIRSLPPAIEGPRLTPTGKKRKPILLLSFCPWCGSLLETPDKTEAGNG